MNLSKTIIGISTVVLLSSGVAGAQIYGNVSATAGVQASTTLRLKNLSTTTRAQMRAEASSTRAANTVTQQAAMIQKAMQQADTEIASRINSLNSLLAKIEGLKKVSDTDKTSITSTTQNEIATLTALKAQIDANTSTTTMRDDLKSITGDYRVYALIEPQIEILAASDRINQIISLMGTIETKLQTRISALQTAGVNTDSLTASMSDIAAKIADATTQATNAVNSTAGLVPDQGNATIAASNTAALKAARADIKAGNTDLQAANKDFNSLVKSIRGMTPKTKLAATTTASATVSGTITVSQ